MEPLKQEIEALREVMFTPLESFVTEKERAERGDEWAENMAHKRMFAAGIKAVDAARGARTTWMVVLRHGRDSSTFYSGFGPYATNAQAVKAVSELARTMGPTAYAVVPTRNQQAYADLLVSLDAAPEGRGDWAVVAEDAKAFKNGWKGKQKDRQRFLDSDPTARDETRTP